MVFLYNFQFSNHSVPGETLRFKPRKRGPMNAQQKLLPSYKNSLNNSINEGVKPKPPPSYLQKRSFTPVRKESHIRGRSNLNKSVLIPPINQERFKSNPVLSSLDQSINLNSVKESH